MLEAAVASGERPDAYIARLQSFDEVMDMLALREVQAEEELARMEQARQNGGRGNIGTSEEYA